MAEGVLRHIKNEKLWVDKYENIKSKLEDLEVLYEFAHEGEATEEEVDESYYKVLKQLDDMEFLRMLGHEEDRLGALMQINPGAGGTESQDWAEMIMRMYIRYGELNNFKINVVDKLDGEGAGIKSVTLEFEGDFAFGFLKSENGVHRLVRLSPFDSANRRHTSFASVYVYPIVDDSIEIDVNPADIRWDTFRSSGPGGQHVNKTESAVRLHHEPSGIVVECQEDRSQLKNRVTAIKMLKSRLYELELRKKQEARQEIEKSKLKIEWGSQIRSYVMHPYKMVKDHRTNYETSNVQSVMDGNLDEFIKAYLLAASENINN
ncbi:MAG: peptide chain release factor 2 [Bacteroidetes bacterium CG2_30_33_31]|nr:MAG: peptide chain release factor 2 [Bacteroidetes bacterium CG2_30_33_31]